MIILLASFVSSEIIIETYTTDFFLGARAEPEVCICGELIDEVILRNNAPFPQVFDVSTNLERATIGTTQITLNPKQEIIIPILISAACTERTSVEEYIVRVRSTTGEQQEIRRNLEIKDCQTIQAKLYTDKNTTNICTPVTYTVLLTNPSTFQETYLVGPLNNAHWYDERGYEVTLNPQQRSILNFTFIPACEKSGHITNKFRIESQKTNLRAELSHDLYIEPGYNFLLRGPEQITACRLETIMIPYNITNQGLINNSYETRLLGNPGFVSLQQETKTLQPGETSTFYLEITPEQRARDEYEFQIITQTQIGNEEAVKNVTLNLQNCYEATITIKDPESLKVCQGHHELDVQITNQGTKNETYVLGTNTPTAVLEKQEVSLEPGQTETIKLRIDATRFDRRILFEVHANSTRDLLINWEDSILLDIVPVEKCAEIRFPRRYNIYSRYYEEQVSITVKNVGFQKETYNIKYFGDDFLELKENQTTIEPGQEYEVILQKTKEHEQDEYYFAIEFITSKDQKYNKEFRLILTGTPITEQITEYAKQNPCFLVALIIITIIILYLISLIVLKPYMNKTIKIIAIAIILLILIITLITVGLPQRVNPPLQQPEDPYSFKMYEEEKLRIDLKEYVFDPDGDPLTFTIEDEPRHMNITQQENIITIKPKNFTGNDRFRIKADDGRSGTLITPRFNVESVPLRRLTALELYEKYCVYINLIMLLILMIIILITKNKPTKQTKTETTTSKATAKKTSKKKAGRPQKKTKK